MLSIIVAVSKNSVIGFKNGIPWELKDDLQRFREITLNHKIVMGRKTFESLKKPLDKRVNIILTRNKAYSISQNHNVEVEILYSIEEISKYVHSNEEVFVIGGEEIYRLLIPKVNKVYLTLVNDDFEGDAYFPMDEVKDFQLIEKSEVSNNGKLSHEYLTYIRK